MERLDTEALRRAAAEALDEAEAMQRRCADVQADDIARRARVKRAAERYEAEMRARRSGTRR
jgi:hypothetical protein